MFKSLSIKINTGYVSSIRRNVTVLRVLFLPDSGIRRNNTLISYQKAGHLVPTPFLVLLNCSVTIVESQSLQLGVVSDNS